MTVTARPALLLSVPLDRCKSILDSAIFAELLKQYDVHVFTPLVSSPEFRERYEAMGARLHDAPAIAPGLRWRIYNFTEVLRHYGFLYRYRKGPTRLYWNVETSFRWLDEQRFKERTPVRRILFTLLAAMESAFGLRRVVLKLLGRWIFRNEPLERFFGSEHPAACISTAHKTDQEKLIAYHAARAGVRTVFVPDSNDNFSMNGELIHDYDAFCVWGPQMAEDLAKLHAVRPEKIVPLGPIAHRVYDALANDGLYDLRARYSIEPSARIITYLSIWRLGFLDLFPSIDAIVSAMDDGRLPSCVLLLRASPWEDPAEMRRRYGAHPRVRIQAGRRPDEPGASGLEPAREYASTLAQSDLVVMSCTTGAVFYAAAIGVPVMANIVELSEYARGGMSPRALAAEDPAYIFRYGLPAARTLEELVALIRRLLDDASGARVACERIAERWDYRNRDYVSRFLAALEGTPA